MISYVSDQDLFLCMFMDVDHMSVCLHRLRMDRVCEAVSKACETHNALNTNLF